MGKSEIKPDKDWTDFCTLGPILSFVTHTSTASGPTTSSINLTELIIARGFF